MYDDVLDVQMQRSRSNSLPSRQLPLEFHQPYSQHLPSCDQDYSTIMCNSCQPPNIKLEHSPFISTFMKRILIWINFLFICYDSELMMNGGPLPSFFSSEES